MSSLPQPTGRAGVDIDYAAVFGATPSAYLILTPELVICEVNSMYLEATGRTREQLVGKHVLEAFPDDPDDPGASLGEELRSSLERARRTGHPDTMAVQRYDVPMADEAGAVRLQERYWSMMNTPVLAPDGATVMLIHRAQDVTGSGHAVDAQLVARARELQELNQRLRQAHAREREVALVLQKAMLPSVEGELAKARTAVRYRPAMGSLNVCGDWYDIAELGDDLLAVAVGDVVGHGLVAAGVMGQLRAALVAATRATGRPDRALEVLDAYARTIDAALGTTVVKIVIDLTRRSLTYSVAGHPPPVLVRARGGVELLDQATGPPLAATADPVSRRMSHVTFEAGDVLALYTDGLVERRTESLGEGIDRLAESVRRHAGLAIEEAADAILVDLSSNGALSDDVAFVLVAL